MWLTRSDPASFIQEAATVGPAAFGDEAKKEASGTSGMMPIEPLMQFGVRTSFEALYPPRGTLALYSSINEAQINRSPFHSHF